MGKNEASVFTLTGEEAPKYLRQRDGLWSLSWSFLMNGRSHSIEIALHPFGIMNSQVPNGKYVFPEGSAQAVTASIQASKNPDTQWLSPTPLHVYAMFGGLITDFSSIGVLLTLTDKKNQETDYFLDFSGESGHWQKKVQYRQWKREDQRNSRIMVVSSWESIIRSLVVLKVVVEPAESGKHLTDWEE